MAGPRAEFSASTTMPPLLAKRPSKQRSVVNQYIPARRCWALFVSSTQAQIFSAQKRLASMQARFLAKKTLHHTKGYHPFGGGNTYCPGRFFARSEIYIFIATTLNRLDLQLAPGERLPNVDLDIPSSSAMPATKDLLVTIRPRETKR